jgi:hypothetical protein
MQCQGTPPLRSRGVCNSFAKDARGITNTACKTICDARRSRVGPWTSWQSGNLC